MRKLALFCLLAGSLQFVFSQKNKNTDNEFPSVQNPLWLRYPAISPDGKTVLFCFKGDIYKVSSEGGQALPLTISESTEFSPVWSHDGKYIAFASTRYGNFDVFIIPSRGGDAKRLTYSSVQE